MSKIIVKKLDITDISPKLDDPAGKLLPNVLKPLLCSFELHNVSLAIARGITRVIESEIPVKAMTFDVEDYDTNDEFMLPDFVRDRIKCIPIKQSIPNNATFTLDVINNIYKPIVIKSSNLKSSGKPAFDDTIDVAVLQPNKYIKIKKIYINEGYGYLFGGFTLVSGARNIPLDQTPLNMYTGEGTPSSKSDPRNHKITFETNGTMDPKQIIVLACREIIQRLNNIRDLLYTITKTGTVYKLIIKNENDTTGNIIMKTVCDLYPDIPAITYNVDIINRVLEISITTDNPDDVINNTIKTAIEHIKKIMTAFS